MMKKNIFFALLAAMLLPLGFAACSSNEDNPTAGPVDPDPEHFDPKVRVARHYFQHIIVSCNEDGSGFEGYRWGKELYPDTDPGHLYIGVDTWEEAAKMFRRYWMAPNARPKILPPSEKTLRSELTDTQGNKQMEVYLKPGETDDVVAELTVSDESKLMHFYKITFLKNSAWPEKPAGTRGSSAYRWRVGDYVKNVTITSDNSVEDKLDSEDEQLDFVCIRSSGNGVKPWFVTVTVHNTYKCGDPLFYPTHGRIRKAKFVPDYDTATEIDSLLHDNWNLIKNAWEECSDIGKFFGTNSENEPFIATCENDTDHYDSYDFDASECTALDEQGAKAPFLLEFDIYDDDEVEDDMTAYRDNSREHPIKRDGKKCKGCATN